MTATPFLVPCLVVLRAEFNLVSPGRDKDSDGWIGDVAHQARPSDHNPDALGRVLAVDIDSSGPWPGGPGWFDTAVESLRGDDRLEYIIWDRRIASRDQGWRWRVYTGSADPHTGHAHFSARHDHVGNPNRALWGLVKGQPLMSVQDVRDYFRSAAIGVTGEGAGAQNRADRNDLATVIRFALGLNADEQTSANMIPNRLTAIQHSLDSIEGQIDAQPTVPGGSGPTLAQVTDAAADGIRAVLKNGVGEN